jgi:hypothetical protein
MTVAEAKERIDAEEFIGWQTFFKVFKPGGARAPADELVDIYAARALDAQIGNPDKQTLDYLLFKPEETEEAVEQKQTRLVSQLQLYAAMHNASSKGKNVNSGCG